MKYFYLVGTAAVWQYPNLDEVANVINDLGGELICFDSATMSPTQLLEMVDGWHDFQEIEESEYDTINNQLQYEIQ